MIDTIGATALDSFGLTDRGLVRDGNDDNFLIAHVSKNIDVRQTSLPSDAIAHELNGAGGYLLAVADGVGIHQLGDLDLALGDQRAGDRRAEQGQPLG